MPETAMLKREVAQVAAHLLSHPLERRAVVRTCLGNAATADSGMAALVERAPR